MYIYLERDDFLQNQCSHCKLHSHIVVRVVLFRSMLQWPAFLEETPMFS